MKGKFHGMTAPTTPSGSLAAWKIGPALATGNSLVLNPAEQSF